MTVPMAADRTNSPAFGGPQPHESKPSSGFTPLPPIRRTSTIDLLSRTKLGADEDDRNPSPVGDSDNDVPPPPPAKEDMSYQNGNGHIPGQGQANQDVAHPSQPQNFAQPPQQHPVLANGQPPNPNGYAVGRGAPQPNGFPQQMFMGRGGPVGPHHQFPGQPGAPMQNPGQPFISQMTGNPIQKFPPNSQWKLEESHLSEPLIQHKPRPGANSPSPQQPNNYAAYDKETEDPLPSAKGQTRSGPRPRNNSNSIPPVSAERYRTHNIFVPQGHDRGHVGPPYQPGHPLFRGGPNDAAGQGGRGSHDAGPSKEMDIHVDEVSVSSTASEERPKDGRRGSGFFSLPNRRNTGEQGSEQNASGKEKSSFFGGVSNHNKFQPKQKSNLGSSFDHDDTSEHVSMKKRLSELTGMIKGVGNAKEGAKDDQPAKPSTAYPSSRPSLQGPMRTQTGQMQPSPLGSPPLGIERSSTGGMRPPETQQLQDAEGEREKKPMGGFLGGLFNKQGSKPQESKQQNQQTPPHVQRPQHQFPMQPGRFGPGQMPPPGQQFPPHPVFAGQQSPMQESIPGQQGRQPMAPGQPNMTSPLAPQFLGTAQRVMMRRPSEITVSSQNQPAGPQMSTSQRSQFGPQQGPQVNIRPATAQDADGRSIGKQSGDDVFSGPSAFTRDSPHRSRPSSPDVGGSQIATRITPNRKPVGSGFSRQDGTSPSSSPQTKKPAKPSDLSQADSNEEEEVPSSQLPSGQQSPTLGKLGHVRQTSLPSPGRPLVITSQPGQANYQPSVGGTPVSPHGPMSPSRDQQLQGQANEGPQRQRGMSQPGQGPVGFASSSSSPSGFGPQQQQHHVPGQIPAGWGPNYSFANQQRPGQPLQHHHASAQGVPRFVALPPFQQETINKFFGTDPRDKTINPATQQQQQPPPKEAKEKSAKERFLGAIKRVSKQTGGGSDSVSGSPKPDKTQHPQKPPPGHHTPPSTARPQQPGQPMTQQQQQAMMTRPQISGPAPAGPMGPMSNMPPGQGRGAPSNYGPMNPPMMSGAGRGGGAPPPQGQAGRGQEPQAVGGLKPQQLVQQRRKSAQNLEPQYDQVPIPRGYEAVHGYGNAGTIAPSPYNVGRPSPPPAPHQQFQSFGPQGAQQQQQQQQQQQWDPRGGVPAGHGQLQPGQQPPSIKRNDGSEASTPTPSDQGTFLDMAPTPPPRPSQDEFRYDRQAPPPVPAQFLRQQAQAQQQVGPQHPSRPEVQTQIQAQTPSSSNWGSAPDSARSGPRKQDVQFKPSDPNIAPPSDHDDAQRPHIATAMSPGHAPTLQPGPLGIVHENTNAHPQQRAFSPTSVAPVQQSSSPNLNPSPPTRTPQPQPAQEPETQGPRLVSKMSATESLRNASVNAYPTQNPASLSPDIAAARAASVSPEPPGPRAPFHQVSSTSLNVMSLNVERANEGRVEEEDLYDATPRMGSAMGGYGAQGMGGGMGQAQDENIKYAGSERSRSTVNGVASASNVSVAATATAGVGLGVGLAVDAAGSQRGSDDSSFSEKQVSSNMDSEEKILVEQPVELAAVNDDDDGIPVMSATSYPGQEWNPYGAGEFGDWD
ncbi:uncharacterized protein F4807DRAFT_386461 [Annulohypoxylon truncatum]|uniref:uncharacterized protein n=1 Tax=Annulohypoxylon truncatum TaxID=327061 RepID=UPI0020079BE9|nr:uncharacterized protein F4807DRAFT_386461 [Annulohypoxylon truncatum]KAI1212049.1 hypothetical protein F4807DRAFT_386461 [Annulohypoxylon truncatum]